MQRFRFRLEALLNYRKLLTDQTQAELGRAVSTWQYEVGRLESLNLENDQLHSRLRLLQQKSVAVDELMFCYSYSERLRQSISDQEDAVMRAENYRDECRDRLAEALKGQKLVEKIKEKKLTQYQEELLSQEQKELDEIGLQLYVRGE